MIIVVESEQNSNASRTRLNSNNIQHHRKYSREKEIEKTQECSKRKRKEKNEGIIKRAAPLCCLYCSPKKKSVFNDTLLNDERTNMMMIFFICDAEQIYVHDNYGRIIKIYSSRLRLIDNDQLEIHLTNSLQLRR